MIMKMWKRILTLVLVLFASVSCFFACGENDKYKDMSISIKNIQGIDDNNTFVFTNSDNSALNTFSFDVEVSGVNKKVDRSLLCSYDPSVLKKAKESYDSNTGITNYEFEALKGDTTLIRFATAEGNKAYDFVLKISVPPELVKFKSNVLAVVRGEEYECDKSNISFYPENVTETAVRYKISAIDEGDNEDIVTANEYLSSTGKILINNGTLRWFYLEVYSDYISSDRYQDRAVVNVIEKIDASKVSIVEDRGDDSDYELLDYSDGKYTLTLASNTDKFASFTQTRLSFNYDQISMGDNSNKFSLGSWSNGTFNIEEKNRFSISIKEDIGDSDIVEVRQSDYDFEIIRKKDGVMTLTFVVDYNDFEGVFEPIEIPVTVKVAMFPYKIRVYSSKDVMDLARGKELKDDKYYIGSADNNDKLILYTTASGPSVTNYLLTPVYVCVWGEDSVIYGQEVEISINDSNVSIVDATGENPIETVTSGGVFYLKKIDTVAGDLVLNIKSTVYEDVTSGDISVECTNEAISISDGEEICADLDIKGFGSSEYNGAEIGLINDNIVEFTGLPTRNGQPDYSVVEVVFESDEYAESRYDADSNDIIIALKNKIGSTRIKFVIKDVYTSNGKEFESGWRKFTVNYPLDAPELLKAQIEGFEKAQDLVPDFVYNFAGSSEKTVSGTAKLLVGQKYNLYYIIGDDEDNSKTYNDISQFTNLGYSPTSSNPDAVDVSGNLISVKMASEEPITITYCFYPIVGQLEKIYICFEIFTESAIKNLTTTSNQISLYDYNTINSQVNNPISNKPYCEEEGIRDFSLGLNPTTANVDYQLSWSIVLNGSGSIRTSSVTTDKGVKYTFTSNKSWVISLTVSGLNASLSVKNIPDGRNFEFDLKIIAKQKYVQPAYTDRENNIGESTIVLSIPVIVKKASYINGISVGAFNNTVKFDIRETEKDSSAKEKELDYQLLSNDDFEDVVIKDIGCYGFNGDIEMKILEDEGKISVKFISISAPTPIYTFYVVALGSRNNKSSEGIDITASNVTTYYNVYTQITVSVADGKTVPFEVDSASDLVAIGNGEYSEALSSNYVLTGNIDLQDCANWQPIGSAEEPFTGTITGRYYIDNNTYNDYEIYNLTISVSNDARNGNQYFGLFGYVGEDASISHLSIKNFTVNILDGTNKGVTNHIGVLSGYNAGTIRDCVVDDGLIDNVLNGAFIETKRSSINYDVNTSNSTVTVYLGGMVGFNASSGIIKFSSVKVSMNIVDKGDNASAKVSAGGLVGTNRGKIYGGNTKETEGKIVYSNKFIATSGVEGYDVVSVINSNRDKNSLSGIGSYGGAVGSNLENGSTAEVFGLTARTFVYGIGNVGGLIGQNNAKVSNSLIMPTLIGSGNVGGLIGYSFGSSKSSIVVDAGRNSVTANKVQMINYNDDYSYMNTGIYVFGSSNVGGLIGSYEGTYNRESGNNEGKFSDEIKFTFTDSLANNSVRSYFGTNIVYEYSTEDNDGKYYGDIVVAKGIDNVNASAFIGSANNIMVATGYCKATIVHKALSSGNIYIGGVLGKATGIVSIFNFSSLGLVYNISSEVSISNVGSFIGDASGINALKHSRSGGEGEFSLNILYRVAQEEDGRIDYNSDYDALVGYGNTPKEDINTQIRYYADKITLSNGEIKYKYANLMYSYSLLQVKNPYHAQMGVEEMYSPNNFFAKGETITVTGANSKTLYVLNDKTAQAGDSIKFTNVIATNSFHLGYTINKFFDEELKTLTNSFVVTSDNLVSVIEGFSLFGLNGITYSNVLTVTIFNGSDSQSFNSYSNTSWQAMHIENNDVTTVFEALYVCENSDTGLTSTSPEKYLKYYNKDVDGGTVIPFAEEKTFTKDNKEYVNLIVDIPPTILSTSVKPEIDVKEGILLSSEKEVGSDVTTINYGTNTLIYYAISKKINYNTMSVGGLDIKVFDFDKDGKYSNLDISYSQYVNNLLASKNIYKLSDTLDISIFPPFLQTGLVSFKSSNSDVAYIEVIDGEAYVVVCGVGKVTFTVYSIYNEEGENGKKASATFDINIISKVDDLGIYADMSYADSSELFTDNSTLTILKSEERSTQVYLNLKAELDYNNEYLENYSKIDLTLENSNSYGALVFLIRDNSIYFDDSNVFTNNAIKINGNSFSKMKFGSHYDNVVNKYAYYVDAGDNISFVGLEEATGLRLLVVPYIIHDSTITILYDLNFDGKVKDEGDLTGGIAKIISLNVVKGAERVSSDSSARFLPRNTQETSVTIKTDNDGAELFFTVAKQNSDKYYNDVDIYSDIDKSTQCEYSTTVNNYSDKTFDGLGVKLDLGVYYFDKVYLSITDISFSSTSKEKIYLVKIGICDKYLFDNDLISKYKLTFNIVDLEAKISSSVTEVEIYGQSISNGIAKTFSSIDEKLENKNDEDYDLSEYYESSQLVAGYPGLLQIDLFPEYANVDYVDITSQVINGYYVSMEQMVAVFNSSNVFDGYYKIYNEKREILNGGSGIRVKNYSYYYNGDYKYSGTYYLRMIIPTTPQGIDSFKITYNCYFEGKVVYSNEVVVNVARIPDLKLTVDGGKTGVVALGKSINIFAETDSEITWSVNADFTAVTEGDATSPIELGGGYYCVNIKPIALLGSDYMKYIGKDLVITATVELNIKGRVYRVSDSVTIRLALFTIDAITVKNVSNGYFHGTYNQPYDLKLSIVASYDEEYDMANGYFISSAISTMSNMLSYYSAGSFYIVDGNNLYEMEEKQYSDLLVSRNGNYLQIKNNRKNITSSIKASITFTYSTYSATSGLNGMANYGINFYTSSSFCYNQDCSFGLDFVRLSNEENPEPIYTAMELMNMEEGGYYILLDDITLSDWSPLDIAIASLDGNGYVLTVESFDYATLDAPAEGEEEKSGELTLGIFSTIYSNTTIKNLIIEVPNNETLNSDTLNTKTGDLVINAQYYEKVTFGLLASTNEGIITNVNVTNNANSYRNQRNKLLFESGAISDYTALSETSDRKLSIVNVNNGSQTSTASENKIAGLVAVNSGYISNSSVTNISIYGLDCVAGFVAENKKVISSSFFSGGNIHANVSADKTKTLGASGFVFENSGKIMYSYSAGLTGTHTNLMGIDISGYAGSTYSDVSYSTPKLPIRYMDTGVVSESGNTSSFVYNNGGSINDCYSNFLVYGSETSGFVYANTGTINNVYTLSSVIAKNGLHNPFISVVTENTENLHANNTGSISNAFFLSVILEELMNEDGSYNGLVADEFLYAVYQVAQPISATKLSNYSTFDSFAFNANMDSVSGVEDMSSIDEIVRGVWFYPSSITDGSIYFKSSSYLTGAPQLVSANLNNYSLKYYITDNESRMIESVYSGLLDSTISTFLGNLGRGDILIDTELRSASNIASGEFASSENKLEDLASALREYGYSISSTDLASQNLQYIEVKLYFEEETYNSLTASDEEGLYTAVSEIESIARESILALDLYGMCYIKVELINKEVNSLPSIDTTYEYVSVISMTSLDNSQNVSIEYGNSVLNPYIIKNANDYNVYVMRIDENYESNVVYNNYQSSVYLRVVKDFAFGGNDSFAKTYNVIYSGILDGNGMTISSLRVNADTNLVNSLQNASNYSEVEIADNKKATSAGMFAKLVDGGTVKNLNVDVSAINATGVNFVGVIAGQVIDSRLFNIDIYSSTNATVLGGNIVGGIAGRVSSQSSMVNLSSSISVSAYSYLNSNKINSKNLELGNTVASRYSIYEAPSLTIEDDGTTTYNSSNFNQVSYAGGVAGVVDLGEQIDLTAGEVDVSAISRVRSIRVDGSPTILGEVVGGLYASLGADTMISASSLIVGANATLSASRIAGGLVGVNYGTITRSYIENADQDTIDASIKDSAESETGVYGDQISNGLQTFFSGNPHYIGGLVGVNISGTIINCYGKVDVNNIDSAYAGGLIGASNGGTINTVYTTANVYAFYGIGGLIGLSSANQISEVYDKDNVGKLRDKYESSTEFADYHLLSHVTNPEALETADSAINMQAVVAVNMWKIQSLNYRRYHINETANTNASIGSIIGYSSTTLASEAKDKSGNKILVINPENIVTDTAGRFLNESMYTIASYTYDSIYNGSNNLVLLEEVGNYVATSCKQPDSTSNSDIVRHYNQGEYSKNKLASGVAVKYEIKTSVDGSSRVIISEKVHYSRLRNLSSVRTLSEIIGRTYNRDTAVSMLSRLEKDENDTNDVSTLENLRYDVGQITLVIGENEYSTEKDTEFASSGDADKQIIYDLNNWDSQIWNGTQVDHQDKLVGSSYILPELTNNVADKIIEIRNYDELVTYTKLYPNGIFYLMNDIVVEGEAKPLCSRGNPFTGTLISNPSMSTADKNTHPNGYKITINSNIAGNGVTALFSAIKGATLKNFEVVVNSELSITNASSDSSIGVLFGYAYSKGNKANTIENINITFGDNGKLKVSTGAKYVGVLGGYGDALYFNGDSSKASINIVNPKIIVDRIELVDLDNIYIGGVVGNASIHSLNTSGYINISNPKITVNLNLQDKAGGYEELAIGSVFGKITNTSMTAGDYALTNINVSDPEMTITLNAEVDKFVYFENVGIGGVFGLVSGQNVSKLFDISDISVSTTNSYKFDVINNGIYAYSSLYSSKGNLSVGGIIGAVGADGKGGVNISAVTLTANNKSFTYTHNNELSNNLVNAKNTSNVNVGASIGAIITCNGDIQTFSSDLITRWTVTEKDKVNINIGNAIGRLNSGNIKNLVSNTNIENVMDSTDTIKPVTLGESTCLNIGGIIGKLSGGTISASGYNANIVVYTSANSCNNVNIGGLVGFASSYLDEYSISSCYAYGDIRFNSIVKSSDIANTMLYSANIGGMVGKIVDALQISDSVTANDIIIKVGTMDGNVFTESNVEGVYNSIGGFVGLLDIENQAQFGFDLVNVYSISNIIVNKSSRAESLVGGIVGKAITNGDYEISGQIDVTCVYYLANFMLDTNNIGTSCSVEELLIDNSNIFNGDGHWLVEAYKYPRLNVTGADYSRLSPKIISTKEISSNTLSGDLGNVSAVVIKADDSLVAEDGELPTINVVSSLTLNSIKDLYFIGCKLNVIDNTMLIETVASEQRIYGIKIDNLTSLLIKENLGKVAETTIGTLASTDGYIGTNKGFDIHPTVSVSSGVLYGNQQGYTLYGQITTASTRLDGEGSLGKYQLTVVTYSQDKPLTNSKFEDSYLTNGTDYAYYGHNGLLNDKVSDIDTAKDISNFAENYDFYNHWIIFTIPEGATEEYATQRKNGRVFLRWELSKEVGGNWYFEGIDMYSNTQIAYKDYSWNNYVNYLNTLEDTSWRTLGVTTTLDSMNIASAEGLAYVSSLVNNGGKSDYKISLSEDIDLSGRLFTPIGGAIILNKMNSNIFSGSFDGGKHTINGMDIITNGYAGLFGKSNGALYSNVTITNSHILSTGEIIGGLVASQQASSEISNVLVSDTVSISVMNSSKKTSVVGGVIGQVYNYSPKLNNVVVEVENSGLMGQASVYNGNYVGGVIGDIVASSVSLVSCTNEYVIKGLDRAGGLIGSIGEGSTLKINKSHNLGDIVSTNEKGIAGGLVGYDKADNTLIQISYNSSYVSGYYASGMVGYLCGGSAEFNYTYVSRGDVGATLNGVENTRNDSDDSVVNNMNTNAISGSVDGAECAYVYVSDASIMVTIAQSYSSIYDDSNTEALGFTNSRNVSYKNSYIIANENDNSVDPKKITHASLSQANNEIFDNWKDIWSRVSQRNNNYPVFMDSAWIGSEEGIEKVGENYYIITTEEQLAWVATQVNTGKDDFDGDTIQVGKGSELTLDFSKKLWSPIGYSDTRSFKGTMDFRNVKIKNLTTNGYYKNGVFNDDNLVKDNVGLFGYTNGATVKGSITFITDDTTINEGSHITSKGNYAGTLIGYAKNTLINNLNATNYLNIQGAGGNVGGLIGGYEINNDFAETEVNIGNFVNYGSVSGKFEDSQNIGGVIGRISAPDDKEIVIKVAGMYNYGTIGAGSGSSSGLVALIEGENLTLEVGVASSTASIENSGTELGGLFGKSEGTLIIGKAIISNDTGIQVASEGDEDAGKIILSSNNTSAHIGAVIGYGNNVTIKGTVYDNDGIKICDKNVLNTTDYNHMSGAIGGFVGYVNNLTIAVESNLEVKNIEFVHSGELNENNNIGGVAGRIEGTLNINSQIDNAEILVNNIIGIKGIGYLGGVAGYIGKYSMDDVSIIIRDVAIEEITDKNSDHYIEYAKKSDYLLYNTYGSIGGAFGYIGGGVVAGNVEVNNITTMTSDNSKYFVSSKTYYAGGIIGRIGTTASLSNLINYLNVIGDFDTCARDIGGVIGYINTTSKTTLIQACENNSSIVTGCEHVGGIVGQVHKATITGCETNNTAIGTYNEENGYGSWFVGGIVGESENATIEFSHFNGSLFGSNYIGGIVGVTKTTNIYTTTANITSIVAKPSANRGVGSHPDIEVFALGGIVGYIYSNTSRSYVVNVDVNMAFDRDKVNANGILVGGAVGYASNTDIKEASTYISTLNVPNVYGIVNKLYNSEYSVNWYCNHYWMVGETDSQENIYMSYVYDLKNNDSAIINESYDETVIYKLANNGDNKDIDTLTTFKFANGNTISNGDEVVESYERVKQIYFEAGLWSMTTSNLSATNPLSENVSLELVGWRSRTVSIEGDATINLESKASEDPTALTYQSVYMGVTQRYRPNKTAINLTLKVRDNWRSCGEYDGTYCSGILQSDYMYSKIYNGKGIILPLGSKFFPINNITIIGSGDTRYKKGYEGYEQNKVSKIYLSSSNYGVGSITDTVYNMYGFVGYTTGTVTITNVEFYSMDESVQGIVSPHAETNADKIIGGIVAVAQNQTVTLDNVSSSISINSGDSYVTGGIIGSSDGSTLNLRGITYKGTISGTSLVAGGVVGYVNNSTINAKEYVNDNKDTSISKSTYEHQCITSFSENISYNTFTDLDESGSNVEGRLKYGIKNEGTVYGEYIAGGLFGVINNTGITSYDENGLTTTNEVPFLLWNTGDVKTNVVSGKSIVGGIIGVLQSATGGYALRNVYSGDLTVKYSIDGDLTYEYSDTQPAYLGNMVGSFVGYGCYTTDGEGELTIEHGVNAVQLGNNSNEITKVSVGFGAVSVEAVYYKDIINFGNISVNVDNAGSFYMEGKWFKPNTISEPSLTSITKFDATMFTESKQEAKRISLNSIINLGNVTSSYSGSSVGGLVGKIEGNICDITFTNCYSNGNIHGDESAGGYIGKINKENSTVIVGTNGDYEAFLDIVGRYVPEESEEAKGADQKTISAKYSGGIVGYIASGNLKGHINTTLSISSSASSISDIVGTNKYSDDVTNYIKSSIKLRATDAVIMSSISQSYVGGTVGKADVKTLIFTSISAPKVGVNVLASIGGVLGGTAENNGNVVFKNIDTNTINATCSSDDSVVVGGVVGYIYNSHNIYFDTISINSEIHVEGSSLAVGGLIGSAKDIKSIAISNTKFISDSVISLATQSGANAGGLIGEICGEDASNVSIESVTISGGIKAIKNNASSTQQLSIGGLIGYVKGANVTLGNKVSFASQTNINIKGDYASAGMVLGKITDGTIKINGNSTTIRGTVVATQVSGSFVSEEQFASAGGIVGYAQNSKMTFNNITLTSLMVKGYVAGGLVGMASGSNTSLEISGVRITSSNIYGCLYVSAVVGIATDGASDKLDDANVNMSLASSVYLKSSNSSTLNGYIELMRGDNNFAVRISKISYTTNVTVTGNYSFKYQDDDGEHDISSSGVAVEKDSYNKTITEFENVLNRPCATLIDVCSIGSVEYKGAYDVYYGNRNKENELATSINIENKNLFEWVKEFKKSDLINNIEKIETKSETSEDISREVTFDNGGNVYSVTGVGEDAKTQAENYAKEKTEALAKEEFERVSERLDVDQDNTSGLLGKNLAYMIATNVPIYRVITE